MPEPAQLTVSLVFLTSSYLHINSDYRILIMQMCDVMSQSHRIKDVTFQELQALQELQAQCFLWERGTDFRLFEFATPFTCTRLYWV